VTASLLAAWWVQALLIAAILAATAAVLQWIARDAVPARAIWALALLGATLLTFVSPLRLWRTSAAGGEGVGGLRCPRRAPLGVEPNGLAPDRRG